MSAAVSADRTHCSVGPRRAQIEATVVPQDPPPRTTTVGTRCASAMATGYVGVSGRWCGLNVVSVGTRDLCDDRTRDRRGGAAAVTVTVSRVRAAKPEALLDAADEGVPASARDAVNQQVMNDDLNRVRDVANRNHVSEDDAIHVYDQAKLADPGPAGRRPAGCRRQRPGGHALGHLPCDGDGSLLRVDHRRRCVCGQRHENQRCHRPTFSTPDHVNLPFGIEVPVHLGDWIRDPNMPGSLVWGCPHEARR